MSWRFVVPGFTSDSSPTHKQCVTARLLVLAYLLLRPWLAVQFPERLGKTLAWKLIDASPRRHALRLVVAVVPHSWRAVFALVSTRSCQGNREATEAARRHCRPSSLHAACPDHLVSGCSNAKSVPKAFVCTPLQFNGECKHLAHAFCV